MKIIKACLRVTHMHFGYIHIQNLNCLKGHRAWKRDFNSVKLHFALQSLPRLTLCYKFTHHTIVSQKRNRKQSCDLLFLRKEM